MRSLSILVAVLLLAGVAPAKPADHERERARQLYQTGTTHYNLGEYQQALTAFSDGYRLRPDPAFLFNIAQCHRQLGDYEEAARSYRAYLREAAEAPNRDEVQKQIAEMDRLAAERAAKAPPTGVQPPSEEHVAPAPAEPAPTTAVTASAPPPKKRTPKWVWITVGVVGAVVVGGAIGLGVGLSSQKSGAPDTSLGTVGATF